MQGCWTTPTADMTYIGSQNHTNMVVGEHKTQTSEVVVVVLLLLDKQYVRIYLNVNYKCHYGNVTIRVTM